MTDIDLSCLTIGHQRREQFDGCLLIAGSPAMITWARRTNASPKSSDSVPEDPLGLANCKLLGHRHDARAIDHHQRLRCGGGHIPFGGSDQTGRCVERVQHLVARVSHPLQVERSTRRRSRNAGATDLMHPTCSSPPTTNHDTAPHRAGAPTCARGSRLSASTNMACSASGCTEDCW